MQNQNPSEKERILTEISLTKEEIWDIKSYINSDICSRCSDMHTKLFKLEQTLKELQSKIANDNS